MVEPMGWLRTCTTMNLSWKTHGSIGDNGILMKVSVTKIALALGMGAALFAVGCQGNSEEKEFSKEEMAKRGEVMGAGKNPAARAKQAATAAAAAKAAAAADAADAAAAKK